MTTIATDGRSMAGDSQVTANYQITGYRQKVHRLPDGSIIGACGWSTDTIKFIRWYKAKLGDPTNVADLNLDESFAALILLADGRIEFWDDQLEPLLYNAPHAIGSGALYAIGAMLAGADPANAVAISRTRDAGTGGDITVLNIGD